MRTQRSRRGRRARRGMAMVTTMLVLMGLMAVMLIGVAGRSSGNHGLMNTTGGATQLSAARLREGAAFDMAEAGVQETIQWLGDQSKPPAVSFSFDPSLLCANYDFPLWGSTSVTDGVHQSRAKVVPDQSQPGTYFTVRVYPDAYNTGGAGVLPATQKKFLIESVGVSGGASVVVEAYVSQDSLSKYLVLLNSWNNSNNFWVSGLTTFDGPVHDNNIGADGVGDTVPGTPDGTPENVLWKSTSGTPPMFTWTGTGSDPAYSVSSPTGVTWYKDSFLTQGAPQVLADGTDQWKNVVATGSGGFKAGTPVVPFPDPTNPNRPYQAPTAALGSLTAAPTAAGMTLCSGGGIYVHGDVSEMALSATGTMPGTGQTNVNQVITVTQKSSSGVTNLVQRATINVTVTPAQTTVEQEQLNASGSPVLDKQGNPIWTTVGTVTGTTNGVVYCDGNIGSTALSQTPTNTQPAILTTSTNGLHGVVADNVVNAGGTVTHANGLTIATDLTKSVNLDGSVTYNTKRAITKDANGNPEYVDANGNLTTNSSNGTPVYDDESSASNASFRAQAGTFGLISKNVLVTKTRYDGTALNNFEMDGAVLATGLYDADNPFGRPVGVWENMGGYLSKTVGTFGMANSSNLLTNGFNTRFNYDVRMRNTPPPFFPTTGHQYTILSWRVVSAVME